MRTTQLITKLILLFALLGISIAQAQTCQAGFTTSVNGNTVSLTNTSTPGLFSYWNFGDGSSSSQANPNHTYASAGSYWICLTAYDSLNFCSDSICQYVTVTGGTVPCQANFNYSTNGSTTHFTNTSTSGTFSYWMFGDGATSSQANPHHTYASPGNYLACLFIYDSLYACSDSICKNITIGSNTNCDASFTAIVDTNQHVGFYPASTSPGLFYFWSFGDGATSTLQYPNHRYSNPGNYLACLYIYDSLYTCSDSVCKNITISGNTNCDASFTAIVDTNQHVGFYPASTSPGLFYFWSFGDGATSTLQYPNHRYSNPGNYLACLYIYDSLYTCSDSVCKNITISGNTNCDASFTAIADTNQHVGFYPASTSPGLFYFWSFGDGATSTLQYPNHRYSNPGSYLACLYIYDSLYICSDSVCKNITISSGGSGCSAAFNMYPDSIGTSGQVVFYSTSTNPSLNYFWTFGDGTYSTLKDPIHYYSPGSYWACLYVYDSIQSCSDSTCQYITIGGGGSGCSAAFTVYSDSTSILKAQFYPSSTTSGLNYFWTFGDGTTSTLQYPNHTYTPGNYWACLYVYDSLTSCSDSNCVNITVTQSGGIQMMTLGTGEKEEVVTDINSFPNPFSGSTTISYTLTRTVPVSINVYDMLGNEMVTLKNNSTEQPGKQNLQWDATGFSNGIYFVNIRLGDKLYTQKLILNNN